MNRVSETLLTRRTFMGASALALASTVPLAVHGQPSTPAPSGTAEASPVVSEAIDEGELLSLSETLVGISPLLADDVPELARLISAEPALVSAYGDAMAFPNLAAPGALEEVPPDVQRLAGNILSFWYVGMFDGLPTPNRADRFAGLLAWQAVPYTTMLTVCKDFGYWSQDIPLTFD